MLRLFDLNAVEQQLDRANGRRKVRRFTWRQVARDADLVAATVTAALAE